MNSTIRTVIHAYNFDTTKPADQQAYDELRQRLKAQGLKKFHSHGGEGHYDLVKDLDGKAIELETGFLYNNQWNTTPIEGRGESGLRVFDWAEDARFDHYGKPVKHIRTGHYLEQTEEMRAIRRDTAVCRYCGHYEPVAKGLDFCPACLGSEYLTEKNFPLTRMVPVADRDAVPFTPLTEAELAERLPLFIQAQTHGNTERDKARLAKRRQEVENKYNEATYNATAERDGWLWMMDRGLKTDNVIYYSHTKRFCVGWRKKLSQAEADAFVKCMDGFPFPLGIERE